MSAATSQPSSTRRRRTAGPSQAAILPQRAAQPGFASGIFNNDVLRALVRHSPQLNIIRVQDTPLVGADDPTLLAWAAAENRILLTHDIQTMPRFAYERVLAGLPMPGVIEVDSNAAVGLVLEDLLILLAATEHDEWEDQVRFVPL